MIRDTVGAFAREQIRPAARPADESGAIPAPLVAKAWQLGLVSGAIPEKLGGDGDARSAVTGAIVAEELGYGDLSIAVHVLAPRLLAFPVLEMGHRRSARQYLKRFTGADVRRRDRGARWSRDSTSILGDATVRRGATAADSCSTAPSASCRSPPSRTRCWSRRQPTRARGFAGVDGFIVARDTPGADGLRAREKHGPQGARDLRGDAQGLPRRRRGAAGRRQGIDFSRLMSQSRVAMAAMGVGVARAAFEYARDYAKERKAFGVPIATKQAIAFMLADMAIEIDAARLLVWEAASQLDKGADALKESYLAQELRRRIARSRSPTTRCRCSAATATSASIRSRCGCATRAAFLRSKESPRSRAPVRRSKS